eukprot:6195107-Pleurochrysis_carterae.AAC.3
MVQERGKSGSRIVRSRALAAKPHHLVALHLDALGCKRDDGAHGRLAADHGDERGVDQLDAVELAGVVGAEELGGNLRRLLGRRRLAALDSLAHRRVATLEIAATLVAHKDQLDLDTLRSQLLDTSLGLLDGSRVV